MQISKFKEVALKYKVIFFDAYGVLKNHKGILPGVKEMLNFLMQNNIEFFILTNDASRSPELLAQKYHTSGVTEITTEKIISSGMLAREYIQSKVQQGKIVYLGTDASAHYIEHEGLEAVSIKNLDLQNCDDVNALVFLDDEGYDWNVDLNKTLNLLRKRSIPVIVANTDATYPVAYNDVAISVGAVADMIERLARKTFIRFGKPDSQIFSYAMDYAVQNDAVSKNEILMVGDSLATDIIGGNKFGIDTCLVLSGNVQPENYELLIQSLGIMPDYVCNSVAE